MPGRPKKLCDPNKGVKSNVAHREENKRKCERPSLQKPTPPVSCVNVGNGNKKPATICKQKNGSFPKNLEKMKVAVETWDTKGADNFDSRNKKPLYKR